MAVHWSYRLLRVLLYWLTVSVLMFWVVFLALSGKI
jgi:hypothetical protein